MSKYHVVRFFKSHSESLKIPKG